MTKPELVIVGKWRLTKMVLVLTGFPPPTQIPLYTIYPGELTRRYGKKRYHPSLILYVNVMKHH